MMETPYARIAMALAREGVATDFRGDDQLIVGLSLPPDPAVNRFWLTFRRPHWYIVTWAPRAYRVPIDVEIPVLSVACLRSSQTAMAEIPAEVVRRFTLEEIDENGLGSLLA